MIDYNQRLELGLTFGASYGPRFNTAIAVNRSGQEQRRIIWSQPLILAQLGGTTLLRPELTALIDFHSQVQGAYQSFRLRDFSDYQSGRVILGTGTGGSQQWQLIKRYQITQLSQAVVSVTRPISLPVPGSLTVFVNNEAVASGWSCNYQTGLLTTNLTGTISVEFEFDIPVRFEQDKIDFTYEGGIGDRQIFSLGSLSCVEVRIPNAVGLLDGFPSASSTSISNSPPSPRIGAVFDLGLDRGTVGGPVFNTGIMGNSAEFERRQPYWTNPRAMWNIGDRRLTRSELNHFITLFRVARGQGIPFYYFDQQTDGLKLVRFAEDRIAFRFDAHRPSDGESLFNLEGISIKQVDA